jgi:lipoate-protein ligase B
VRRWVSYHGFALNVAPDLGDFELIHPCGYRDVRMTSMQRVLGDGCPSWAQVQAVVADEMAHALGYDGVRNESEGVAA